MLQDLYLSAWSTWIYPMEAVVEVFSPRSFLELGMGKYSTPWADEMIRSGQFDRVTGVETDEQWFRESRVPGRENILLESEELFFDSKEVGSFEALLVDGSTESRVPCIQHYCESFSSGIIVVHDFETSSTCYEWWNLKIPAGWNVLRWQAGHPECGVIGRTDDLRTLRASEAWSRACSQE